ncbi:MAG: molybdopterin-synthase adenylyltransferase MoeB [Anaerolineaceae bacterium]|nr:molybdopterin-synthase adenylyltransferase MoeB [Anaerolineaceae bacterium]MDE0328397.1 molybdopterin-synthase adenylyltransferase MoeB [Anaerolineaceae bacterium]
MQALASNSSTLSNDEIRRYSRHIIMPEVGIEGQRLLKSSSILLIGTGGLGSPLALYLAAAGVGRIGLVDYDVVDESNLQRQIIHGQSTLGTSKLESAAARVRDINPFTQIDTYNEPLTSANAMRLMEPYDVIIDGTDNFPTRYLVNDACVKLGKPNVYGSIFRFEGQLSVFYAKEGPCYRCMFPEPPPPGLVPSCAEGGVLGILPGTIGTLQATEGIKLLLGIGEPMIGRMLLYDALEMTFTTIRVRRDTACPVCSIPPEQVELIDYEQFCGMPAHDRSTFGHENGHQEAEYPIEEISATSLKERLDAGDDLLVLDVRNPIEWEIAALDDTLRIPKPQIEAAMNDVLAGVRSREDTVLAKIPEDREIVLHCRTGIRSADSIAFLKRLGYKNRLLNLGGGIHAWSREIDPSLPIY